jgi:hypothetical protein
MPEGPDTARAAPQHHPALSRAANAGTQARAALAAPIAWPTVHVHQHVHAQLLHAGLDVEHLGAGGQGGRGPLAVEVGACEASRRAAPPRPQRLDRRQAPRTHHPGPKKERRCWPGPGAAPLAGSTSPPSTPLPAHAAHRSCRGGGAPARCRRHPPAALVRRCPLDEPSGFMLGMAKMTAWRSSALATASLPLVSRASRPSMNHSACAWAGRVKAVGDPWVAGWLAGWLAGPASLGQAAAAPQAVPPPPRPPPGSPQGAAAQ